MKNKIDDYNKSMIEYIEHVCECPSPPMLEIYSLCQDEVFKDSDFLMMLHLAVNVAERYRLAEVPVWRSRELEMMIYDMHQKGHSLHEMLIVCQVAMHMNVHQRMANSVFGFIGKLITDSAKKHGDVIFNVGEGVFYKDEAHKAKHPKLPKQQFSNN